MSTPGRPKCETAARSAEVACGTGWWTPHGARHVHWHTRPHDWAISYTPA